MQENKLLEVALLGKTVGLKGALKLHDRSDFPSQFKKGAKFYLADKSTLEISLYNSQSSTIMFDGYESIERASLLVNKMLYQSIEETKNGCKLKKDEFFYFDIIGLVIEENNQILGIIEDIVQTGGGYLFEIATDELLINNGFSKKFYVPYIDHYVVKISLENKIVLTKNAFSILENS